MTAPPSNIRHLRPVTDDASQYTEWPVDFERDLVYACVHYSRFWSLIGTHLHADALRDKRGKPLLEACSAIARETGDGPTSPVLVIRRLQAKVEAGSMKPAELDHVCTLLDEVEDRGVTLPNIDQLAAEASGALKRRRREAVLQAITLDTSKGKSLARYAPELEAIEQIGKETATGSVKLDAPIWQAIEAQRSATKLPTGIAPVDDVLGGGVKPKTLTVWGADQNVGKTAAMVHMACFNWMAGKRIIFVPTEESVADTMTRVISWITGLSMDEVGRSTMQARQKLARVLSVPTVGAFACEYLPQGSPVSKLRKIIDQALEDHPEFGGGFDACFVDYADKLKGKGTERNRYEEMGTIYEQLRQIAVDHGNWMVTGSQLKDLQGKKTPTIQDLRDSRKKGDIADCGILLYKPDDQPEERNYFIGKHRGPGAGQTVGPLPTDLDVGRIAIVNGAQHLLLGGTDAP